MINAINNRLCSLLGNFYGQVSLVIVALCSIVALKIFVQELYRTLTYENGIFEWLQFFCFAVASSLFFCSAIVANRDEKAKNLWLLLCCLGVISLFIAMEEIGWGQWVFGIKLSEYFQKNNFQQNLTIHNLNFIQPHLHTVTIIIGLSVSFFCSLEKFFQRKFGGTVLRRFIAPAWLSLYFIPLPLFYIYTDWLSPLLVKVGFHSFSVTFNHKDSFIFYSDQESIEVLVSFGVAIYSAILLARAVKYATPALTYNRLTKISTQFIFSDIFILSIFSLALCLWYGSYFTSNSIPSVDLPSFISGVESLRSHIFYGRISFYEHHTFNGWSPFLLYGVIPSIFVTLFSFITQLVSFEPVRLATHIALVLGTALFPWCFYYAARALWPEISLKNRLSDRLLLLLSTLTYSFWFLNHDHQWYGIGAAAPMNIGLFAQLFAWHFMLLYLGSLIRIVQKRSNKHYSIFILTISLGLLIPTHLLSAIYCIFIGGLFFLRFYKSRLEIFTTHILAIGLSSFWLFPFLAFVGDIAPLDIHRPSGDFLELFFRYPTWGFIQTVKTWIMTRDVTPLHPIYFFNITLLIVLIAHKPLKQNTIINTLFLFILISLIFFSSGFIATSLQVGFHYYRFTAYVFLFLTVIFTVLPLYMTYYSSSIFWQNVTRLLIAILLVFSTYSTFYLPHYERQMIIEHSKRDYLFQEKEVLRYFSSIKQKGRIYIEYLNDYDRYPFLSAHYLSSRIPKESGFEILPNSHLQEAPAYRMIAGTAKLLGANTYNVPLLFTDTADLTERTLVRQLKDFGITHVIAGTKKFANKLLPYAVRSKRIGRYIIITLDERELRTIKEIPKKTLIAYRDNLGTAPFHLVQYYFYSRQELYRNFKLINVLRKQKIPDQAMIIIENGAIADNYREKALIAMNYSPRYILNHYSPHYPHNTELDQYKNVEKYMEDELQIKDHLKQKMQKKPLHKAESIPRLNWLNSGQSLRVSGLEPDTLYEINYTYFPLWRSKDAILHRGIGEKIYLIPKKRNVEISFSRWNSLSSWLGLALSLLSMQYIIRKWIILVPRKK